MAFYCVDIFTDSTKAMLGKFCALIKTIVIVFFIPMQGVKSHFYLRMSLLNCYRLEEAKEIQQLQAMWDPRWILNLLLRKRY